MRRAGPDSRVRALGQGSAWNRSSSPGARERASVLSAGCSALSRPLSSPRPAFAAAGLPTHPGVGAPVASGGGEGRKSEGVGLGKERRKGGRGRLRTPMASSLREGHLSSQPLSRPPMPRPCTGMGRGRAQESPGRDECPQTGSRPRLCLFPSRALAHTPVSWPGQPSLRGNLWPPRNVLNGHR